MVPKMMMVFFEIVCVIVRAQVLCMFVHIEDGSSSAVENVELFFAPKVLFNVCAGDRHRHTFRVHIE
jgi:heme/copper-type cytochrome/quinol oxidase subunit 4